MIRHDARSRAFTLVEMLVALAVLVLALAVVTNVFRLTSDTAKTSSALTDVHARLNSIIDRLKADLNGIDPSQSILVIHGRTQAAARTQEELDGRRFLRFLQGDPNDVPVGYQPDLDLNLDPGGADNEPEYSDPRADLLMFLTNTAQASQAPPNPPPSGNPPGVYQLRGKHAPLLVKYGHAALDRVDPIPNTTPPAFRYGSDNGPASLRHVSRRLTDGTLRSELPVLRWHLGRVATIIEPTSQSKLWLRSDTLFGKADFPRVMRCDNYTDPREPGDVALLNVPLVLQQFGPNPTLALPQPAAEYRPYNVASPALGPHWPTALRQIIFGLLGPGGEQDFALANGLRHIATVVEHPPTNLQGNLGVHGLPACAWFEVEFLMPEDPRNARDYYARADATLPGAFNRRSDLPRWTSVPSGQTFVFVPDTAENAALVAGNFPANPLAPSDARVLRFGKIDQRLKGPADPPPTTPADSAANRRVRMWPYAIRITVRAYDPEGRLDNPVERSIVHRFD